MATANTVCLGDLSITLSYGSPEGRESLNSGKKAIILLVRFVFLTVCATSVSATAVSFKCCHPHRGEIGVFKFLV